MHPDFKCHQGLGRRLEINEKVVINQRTSVKCQLIKVCACVCVPQSIYVLIKVRF